MAGGDMANGQRGNSHPCRLIWSSVNLDHRSCRYIVVVMVIVKRNKSAKDLTLRD